MSRVDMKFASTALTCSKWQGFTPTQHGRTHRNTIFQIRLQFFDHSEVIFLGTHRQSQRKLCTLPKRFGNSHHDFKNCFCWISASCRDDLAFVTRERFSSFSSRRRPHHNDSPSPAFFLCDALPESRKFAMFSPQYRAHRLLASLIVATALLSPRPQAAAVANDTVADSDGPSAATFDLRPNP